MTAVPPEQQPSDATVTALASIDLSGGEEAPVQTFGRILGGLVLLILGGAGALAFMAVYIAGDFIPGMADWRELLGDGLLYASIIAFVIAVTGFELLRRGRKARKAEAAEAADIISKLGAAGALDGTATAAEIENALGGPRTGDMDPGAQKPIPGPTETHL
jgi:Co/Zn/Cd efflux system component